MHVAPLLEKLQLEQSLTELPGWAVRDKTIYREYQFSDFESAFSFMTEAALRIVKMDHHPEWTNVYNRLRVTLWTHDAGGVTERDIRLARTLEKLAKRFA